MLPNWWKLTSDMAMANLEAQRVIALRMGKFAAGGAAAEREARRMVAEKIGAAAEAGLAIASGGSPQSILRRYRTIMRANSKRLSRTR